MAGYGYHIGIAFQIKDDILDFTGTEKFGKKTLQDAGKGLKTLPAVIGLSKAQEKVKEYSDEAIAALENIENGISRKALIQMARQLEKREI